MQKRRKSERGFTLVELLVVIAIIGILSTTILVSLGGARAKAKDAKRQSDIRQMSLAMELDYSDDEKYSQYTTAQWENNSQIPKNTGRYLDTVLDPAEIAYGWLDNSATSTLECNSQVYCVYAELAEGGYFAGSPKGTKKLYYDPSDNTVSRPKAGKCPCW